jgi:hypothetical protein
MKFHALLLWLALNAAISLALKIPIRHAKRSNMQRRGASVSVSIANPGFADILLILASGTGFTGFNAFTAKCVEKIVRRESLIR